MLYLALPLTLGLYFLVRLLYRRFKHPLINTVLLPTLLVIGVLLLFIDPMSALGQYQLGSSPIAMLLQPAVVALALPLYLQINQIRKRFKPIIVCALCSVVISVFTALILGTLMGIKPEIIASLVTRSVTTPLAMPVSISMGGIGSIAAAVVVIVGLIGAVAGYPLLKLLRVSNPEAQGLAIGACAHALGTVASAEKGITQGAFASLAMVVCGILTAILAPLLMALFIHFVG